MNTTVRGTLFGTAIICTCIFTAACGDKTDTSATTDTTAGMMAHNDTVVAMPPGQVMKLGDANIFAALDMANSTEVAEGKLAQQKGKSADVKSFGKMLIDDHSKMKKEGSDLAKSLNITPEPMPGEDTTEMHQDMEMMQSMSGAAFDSAFVVHEIDGHHKTLNDLNRFLAAATNDSLKIMISKAIPTVQHHLDRAQQLQERMMKMKP